MNKQLHNWQENIESAKAALDRGDRDNFAFAVARLEQLLGGRVPSETASKMGHTFWRQVLPPGQKLPDGWRRDVLGLIDEYESDLAQE